MFTNEEYKDAEILIEQLGSTKLPPFLNYFKKFKILIDEIDGDKIPIYKRNSTNQIISVNHDILEKPKYIFNKGSESIKYFSFKNNLSKRPMGIANPVWFFSFIYNIIQVNRSWLEDFYNDESNHQNLLVHSNSPIIGRKNRLKFIYTDQEIVLKTNMTGLTNEKEARKDFMLNQEKTLKIEGTNPLYLHVDIESYFNNIYTHQLSSLSEKYPYNQLDNTNSEITDFFNFLDVYNMAINDNHTKGILQGPISSGISAEFLGIHLDYLSKNDHNQMAFVRYVDDFTFFSNEYSKLELQLEHMDRVFRKVGLFKNNDKTRIDSGYPPEKSADLEIIHIRFPYLQSNEKITVKDFITLRSHLKVLVNDKNITQIRTLLTKLTSYFSRNYKSTNFNNKQSVFLVPMILKLVYSFPVINHHVYTLVDIICQISNDKELERIMNIFVENTSYIESHYAETEIHIWHFYLLSKYAKPKVRNKILKELTIRCKKDSYTSDSILLSFFVKNNFSENLLIYEVMKYSYMTESDFDPSKTTNLQGIGASRWWPVALELYLYTLKNNNKKFKSKKTKKDFNNLSKKISQLFLKKSKPNYSELGIFIHLL